MSNFFRRLQIRKILASDFKKLENKVFLTHEEKELIQRILKEVDAEGGFWCPEWEEDLMEQINHKFETHVGHSIFQRLKFLNT